MKIIVDKSIFCGIILFSTLCADIFLGDWKVEKKEISTLINDKTSDRIIEIATKLVKSEGAHNVTVRKVLKELGATNRVFYNRFRNIAEVLEIVYKNSVYRMHKALKKEYDGKQDFFDYVTHIATLALTNTYEINLYFSSYMFENSDITTFNCDWWTKHIKELIEFGKANNLIKDEVDSDKLSYSVWCFCRGYNADSVIREVSLKEAIKSFRYGFGIILDGIKKQAEPAPMSRAKYS